MPCLLVLSFKRKDEYSSLQIKWSALDEVLLFTLYCSVLHGGCTCLSTRLFLTPPGASESPNQHITSALVGCWPAWGETNACLSIHPFLVVHERPMVDGALSGSFPSSFPLWWCLSGLLVSQQPAKPPWGHTRSQLMCQSQLLIIAQPPSHQLWLDVKGRPVWPTGAPRWLIQLKHVVHTDKWETLNLLHLVKQLRRCWIY